MRSYKVLFLPLLISILFLSIFFTSCSDNDTARVTINLKSTGLALTDTEKAPSIIDRIINVLTLSKKAYAVAPVGIKDYHLTVTGPNMDEITGTYPPDTETIHINIPAGLERRFTLITEHVDESGLSAVTEYKGVTVTHIQSGLQKTIQIWMLPSETKIVIPDFLNNRIVQIDDMSGADWRTLSSGDITGLGVDDPFAPYDIAFDAQGRIYVANNPSGPVIPFTKLFRIDSIPAEGKTEATVIINKDTMVGEDKPFSSNDINWIAIDMKNSILYFATDYEKLYKADINGGNVIAIPLPNSMIKGINVDEDGMVYIARDNGQGVALVEKYNRSDFTTPVATFDCMTLNPPENPPEESKIYTPRHMVVKSGKVYVAIAEHFTAANLIVQLDSNLDLVGRYGTGADNVNDTDPGHFFGPCHFVATLNRKLYIIDDGGILSFNYKDRLVSMDDIDGTNWATYEGPVDDPFKFYYGC